MYEAIREQFESRRVMAKQPFYQNMGRVMGEFFGDMYPVCMSYYHELNPAFLMQMQNLDVLNSYRAITVRDGLASFGTYVLKNFQKFSTLNTHFIISPTLSRLLPPDSSHKFSAYRISHLSPLPIQDAKKVLISGISSQDTLELFSKIKERLQVLREVGPECEIEIFFPQRKNPLGTPWRETYTGYEIIATIRELLPKNKITFLTMSELLGQTSFKGYYCLDLLTNNLTVTDSYLNHFLAARGGTVSSFENSPAQDAIFELELSFYHKLQVVPLKPVDSIFPEMIFYKKQAGGKDYLTDQKFHRIILQE